MPTTEAIGRGYKLQLFAVGDRPLCVCSAMLTKERQHLYLESLQSSSNTRVSVLHGPPKSLDRALEKAQGGEGKAFKPNALKDLNRATILVDRPLNLAAFYHGYIARLSSHGAEVVQIKNKFKGGSPSKSTGDQHRLKVQEPPNLHVNVKLPIAPQQGSSDSIPSQLGWIAEIQMTYRDVLKIKKWQHKYYELNRVDQSPENFLIVLDDYTSESGH